MNSNILSLKRAGPYVEDWGEELSKQHQIWEAQNQSSISLAKRPAPSNKNGADAPRKKTKVADNEPITDSEMKDLFEKNHINKVS